MELTDRDKEVLHFIDDYTHEKHFPPTVREIGAAVFMSKSTVNRHLFRLCSMGYISMVPRQPRTIVLKVSV